MKPSNDNIIAILWKNLTGDVLIVEEQAVLQQWLSESVYNQQVFNELTDKENLNNELKFLLNLDDQSTWQKILHAIEAGGEKTKVVKLRRPWLRYASVAAALIAVSVGAYLFISRPSEPVAVVKPVKNTTGNIADAILPASPKATLTLADGSVIDLSKEKNGVIVNNKNYTITNNLQEGELVIDAANSYSRDNQIPITLNTLSTPRGGFYRVVLPDGSKIWLNAASTLRFPTLFSSKERTVELTGEAYCEVQPVFSFSTDHGDKTGSAKSPFHIKINDVDVNVLGTSFNIKAYTLEDHKITTTLVDGAVVISRGDQSCQLKPGEQARVNEDLPVKPISHEHVDTKEVKEVVSWKNGYFIFDRASIDDIMKEVSRWYNVEVIYKGAKPQGTYSGTVVRNISISGIIKILQANGIRAKVMCNKLVVSLHQ